VEVKFLDIELPVKRKNCMEGDYFVCECGERTLLSIEILESPYTPRNHKGWILTNHTDDCRHGIQQRKELSWQHMGIGFGL
jgi:hypothetical protein